MNEHVRSLQVRFSQLEKRERYAVSLMVAFLAVVFFYLAIWSPANAYLENSRSDYDRHLNLLSYLKSTEAEARNAAGDSNGPAESGQSLLTSVSGAAQSTGIKPSRLQPEGGEAVSVWFDSVAFTQLMLWLERLEARQGIVVRQISVDRRDEPGQVSARIVLRR